MPTLRCDAIVIQIIATKYDDSGRPVDEIVGKAQKIFRANAPDVWKEIDATIAELEQRRREAAIADPGAGEKSTRPARRRRK
jgi:hypothetical protein